MKLPRRSFLHLAAGAAAAVPALSRIARAETYPARPVRVIVPFGSAGATDIVARLVGQWLSERLRQQFIIDNRPGAGSNIGTEAVIRSAPDGYTLLLVGPAAAINATLYEKLSFNFIRDIAPVAGIVRFPDVMVVNPSVPVATVPELIAYAKANPGKINFASTRWNCHDGTNRGSRFLCIRQHRFFARLRPTPVAAPRLVRLNKKLAWHLELDPESLPHRRVLRSSQATCRMPNPVR